MKDNATIARDNALNCEAKKHAYRQTQDGVVVSFVLHPQEVPEGLATAPLGTRYVLAMVALNDDETPKLPAAGDVDKRTAAGREADNREPSTASRKSWHELSPAQQAGILCSEPAFWKFCGAKNEETAAGWVRSVCGVNSRKDIRSFTMAAKHWGKIASDYRAWMREPEMTG